MSVVAVPLLRSSLHVTTRLLVTVRDPTTRAYRPVGFLGRVQDRYRFAYLRREVERDDCQGTRGSPCGRSWDLLVGGQFISLSAVG